MRWNMSVVAGLPTLAGALAAVLLVPALSGCGQKGPLTLPQAERAAPAAAPAPASGAAR